MEEKSIIDSLAQSLEEMKLMQEGKLPKSNWDDFAKEMREMIEEDEEE